jgi:glutaredoxin
MARSARPIVAAAGALATLTALAAVLGADAHAQQAQPNQPAQQVYRYVDKDGRVVYSDRQPSGDAKDVQPKRMGANYIENSELPYAAQQAMDRYPVTLYTFACGELCQSAEGLLNRRGVPFTSVNVEDPKGAEQLKNLTGELTAPVLQVGDKLIGKGFNEIRWTALLDQAGYPKAPASRRSTPARPPAAETPAEPPVDNPASAVAPTPGSGYPKD